MLCSPPFDPLMAPRGSAPSVLAVVVAHDGARWLKQCLASLTRQAYPRLGVMAVDNASTDGSGDVLEHLLGPRRVLRMERNEGFPAAVARVMAMPMAAQADYILLVHDDTALGPNAVRELVAAARSLDGVGVVGPKVLDWGRARVLREVGLATDRFGFPYSPVEEGELDQGQYDSPREVLYVSSAAMLVSREAWTRSGPPDERLRPCHGDLDFCWRVRVAGFRVLVSPEAVVLHRAAGGRLERSRSDRARYLEERSSLTSVLKNYRLFTLAWLLPVYAGLGLARMVSFAFGRRWATARQVLAAWGWALAHYPGTFRRRRRLRRVRQTPDREITRFMAPTGSRMRRWVGKVAGGLAPARPQVEHVDLEEEPETAPLRIRAGELVTGHPVALAWIAGILLTLISFREVLFAVPLQGGAFPSFPEGASDLFRMFGSGWTPSGFGGSGGASPALVPLGLGSVLTFGNPRILAWLFVAGAPLLAALSCYRAVSRTTEVRGARLVAAAGYALSAVSMWAVSEGRIAVLVLLIALPWLAGRVVDALEGRAGAWIPWVAGTGLALALTGSFFPAVWVPVGIVLVLWLPGPPAERGRGLSLVVAAIVAAAVLVLPFTLTLMGSGPGPSAGVDADFADLARLSPGEAPGSWLVALFLPVAGILGLAAAGDQRTAWRAGGGAGASIILAWLAAAGRLPDALGDPVAYLGLAAFLLSLLVAMAFGTLVPGVRREAFGSRQLGYAGLALLVAAGILLQSFQAARGAWAVGQDRLPPAWPVVATSSPGIPFRTLWLGPRDGGSFPPPGGTPDDTLLAGPVSVSYGVTGRAGRPVSAIGLPASGPGFDRLERALAATLAGDIRHGGSLLAPLGIFYVVAGQGELPPAVKGRLDDQLDLIPVQRAGGLVVYRNARALPVAAAVPGPEAEAAARARSILAPSRIPVEDVVPLRPTQGSWRGAARFDEPGSLLVATEHDDRWRVVDLEASPFPAFGWALGFDLPAGRRQLHLAFGGQWIRNLEVALLAALWAWALWLIRRRPRAESPATPEPATAGMASTGAPT